MPLAIIGGVLFLTVTYIGINIALFKIFTISEMVSIGHNASSIAAQKMFGTMGGNIIAVGIMISILGGLNGYVMTLSRNTYIMGRRGQIFCASLWGSVSKTTQAPVNAIVLLAASAFFCSSLLDADKLTDIAMFSIWIFYLLTFVGVLVARKSHAANPRPYKVPLYPIIPLIAIGGALYVIYGMMSSQFVNGIVSICLTLSGLPLYYYLNRNRNNTKAERQAEKSA